MHFFDKLEAAIAQNSSLLVVGLDPNPEMMPDRIRQADPSSEALDGLRDWLHEVIAATADSVCAYKPTLGFYLALGTPGLALLEEVLKAVPHSIPIILDAKHSDLNTCTQIAQTLFVQWQVDAVTLNPYPGQDIATPFLLYPNKAVFVLCCTSNPSARNLQQNPASSTPLYLELVEEVKTWGLPQQLGLEVGTTDPATLAKVRALAPERLILARSIWQEGVDLAQLLAAGLDANGEGLLIPVPQDWMGQHELGARVRSLRDQVNQARTQIAYGSASCDLWFSNVCTVEQQPHLNLILQLYDVGCILFGEFVQASGAVFPYYIDLRKIISNPQLFQQVLNAYAAILKDLEFDRIAGIPYGSLPTATGLSLRLNCPLIFPRKEVKAHGTRRLVEGNFEVGETAVVVDDILISGNSAIEGAEKLKSVGLNVNDIVVFLDHEQGVKTRLKQNGYRAHSVLTISQVTKALHQAGRITDSQLAAFTD